MKPPAIEPLLTKKQICKLTGLSAHMLTKLIRDASFPYVEVRNGDLRFEQSAVEAWLEARRKRPSWAQEAAARQAEPLASDRYR